MVAKSARSAAAGGEHPFMRWLISARASGVERHWRRVGGVALAAVLGLALAGSGSGAPGASQTGKATAFTGYAFDACNAPKIDSLAAWLASPYRALGIYIGGVNRACANNQLTPDWTAAAVSTGWGLIPLYVGLQAPCVGQGGLAKISPSLASSQGTAAADDADARASTVGLAPGSPIYFDMEGYALSNASCSQAVQSFVTAWVNELHALGHLAGIYGSAASTIRDMQALATTASAPDDVWIANWNDNESVYGDPYVSDALWTNHQRLHQYRGSHHETWGGVTIDIDSNYVDGAVVGAGGTLPVPAPPIPLPSPGESAAGSVTAVDESSSVSWPAGAFQQSVVVSLTPALPVEPVDGFGHGGYGVQLQVQQTATAALRKGVRGSAHDPHRPPARRRRADDLERRPELAAAIAALRRRSRERGEGRLHPQPGRLLRHPDHRRRVLRSASGEGPAARSGRSDGALLARPARAQLAEVGRLRGRRGLVPRHARPEAASLDPGPDDGGDPPRPPHRAERLSRDRDRRRREDERALEADRDPAVQAPAEAPESAPGLGVADVRVDAERQDRKPSEGTQDPAVLVLALVRLARRAVPRAGLNSLCSGWSSGRGTVYARECPPGPGGAGRQQHRKGAGMDQFKELPREAQITIGCLVLFVIFSFFDWQQVSYLGATAGRNLWHGVGIITVLIAIAYLIWEIGRALNYKVELGSGHAADDLRRFRDRAPRLHGHHLPRLERLPPLAGVGRAPALDRHRRGRVQARQGRGRRDSEDAAERLGQPRRGHRSSAAASTASDSPCRAGAAGRRGGARSPGVTLCAP